MIVLKGKKWTFVIMSIMLAFYFSNTMCAQTLVLWHANGTTTDVELATKPKVTFENNKVFIRSTILDLELPKQDILRFTYKSNSTGISGVKNSEGYTQENGRLVFHGIKSSDDVSVYTLKGIRVPVHLVRNDDSITLPLNALSKGVYLLNVNGRTSKFVKK